MTDYSVAYRLGDIAKAIEGLARAQAKIAEAAFEANRIELDKQKREWRADGGTPESWRVQ